jgi:putative ABC transport system permease protein
MASYWLNKMDSPLIFHAIFAVMFKNYFKTAIRSLLRNRNYTIINIAGLATGVAVCLLIFVIIQFETGFDGFHAKKDRIYRVLTEYHHPGDHPIFYGSSAPYPLANTLKSEFPELKQSAGIFSSGEDQVLVLDSSGQAIKKFKENKGVFAVEPSFFDLFDFPWLAGNPSSSLKDPLSAVLTQETADRYFGDWRNALGRTIKMNGSVTLKVTGILATVPPNTDFQFKIILPYKLVFGSNVSDWGSSSDANECYVLLPPAMTQATLDRQLRRIMKKYRPAESKDELASQPLSQVHYYDSYSHTTNFLGRTIAPEVIRVLWIIAAFILVIACVNFINLATAQSVNRAREIGVRKVMGSSKSQLRIQFLTETFLLVAVSVLIAMILTSLVVVPVGRMLDLPLSLDILKKGTILIFLFGLLLLVTLLAGLYPSFVLSSFNPIQALKSKLESKSNKGVSIRRGLVVFQFVIAQALIIGTIIIVKQMSYFKNESMGFDKDAVISVPLPGDSSGNSKIDYLRASLLRMQGVNAVSFNSTAPATDDNNWSDFEFDHGNNGNKGKQLYSIIKWVDASYLKTYNLPLVAGRNLSSDTAHEWLITENMVKKLGIDRPQDALNKEINLGWSNMKGPIVGVLKDFHSTGFKDRFSLVFVTAFKRGYRNVGIKLGSENPGNTLKAIEKLWNQTFPNYVFEYQFLDESIANFYKQENEQAQLYKIFAFIAIFLGCLGLYGLASFMAIQRVKEVGIRKVLGASVKDIVYLFSREFFILIGIAFLIASPIAWYFMHKWLQDYAFRIPISGWFFVAGGAASLIIALGTICFNAVKAAIANPVESLRSE